MSAPYARFFTPPLHGGSFPLPRARDVVKTSVFTRPRKRDSSTLARRLSAFTLVLISHPRVASSSLVERSQSKVTAPELIGEVRLSMTGTVSPQTPVCPQPSISHRSSK